MRSVDTNILVRWVARDDEEQARLADAIMEQPSLISATVLVEVAWVLGGSRIGLNRPTLVQVLSDIVSTSTVSVSDENGIRWAIDRYAAGADFADMVHLVASRGSDSFVTFDQRLAADAGALTPIIVETLG